MLTLRAVVALLIVVVLVARTATRAGARNRCCAGEWPPEDLSGRRPEKDRGPAGAGPLI